MNTRFLQDLFNAITQRDAQHYRRISYGGFVDHTHVVKACRTLLDSDGEASSIALVNHVLTLYARLDSDEKARFFDLLTHDFSANPDQVDKAYTTYQETRDVRDLQSLFHTCEPSRQELLRRLNLNSNGTYELVRMHEDLLSVISGNEALRALHADFKHLFSSWFNRGFLVLRHIDWNTSASILERIIHYEAVHEIQDWSDLRRRLDERDRRCFAFFHPAMGDEPLIFVEIALHNGIPTQVQSILGSADSDIDKADVADTAAFYGISNCHTGLRGVSFGNFLIKQVVQELKQELPNLRHFATLSPVPGFRRWLETILSNEDSLLDEEARNTLAGLDETNSHNDPTRAAAIGEVLRPLAAHYLLHEKNRHGLPLDPVARFHLGNGAELHLINWPGDISTQGFEQSAGIMVNYLYVDDKIERNHERYTANGTIACSSNVRNLDRHGQKLFEKSESYTNMQDK